MLRVAFVCVLLLCSPVMAVAPSFSFEPVCDGENLVGVIVEGREAGRWLVWTDAMCKAHA